MTGNLLPAIVAVQIFFGVSEGLTLTECKSGCIYVEDRTTNIVTCEGFHVNEIVTWDVFYQNYVIYRGTCNGISCSPIQEGVNATVLPAGNASLLTIDLRVHLVNFYIVRCSSGGQTVRCTLRYAACPSTTAVITPPDTTSSTEFVQNITTTQTSNGGKQGDSGNELPVGAIAGGVGAFVVVVIIAVLIFIYKRRGANKDTNNPYVNVEDVQQSTDAGHKVTTDAVDVLHDATPNSGLYAVVNKSKKTRHNTPRDVSPVGSQTELVSSYAQADFHGYAQVNDNRGANIGDSGVQDDVGETTGGVPLSEMYATVQKGGKSKPKVPAKPKLKIKGNEDGYTAISLVPRASTGGGTTPELGQGPADGQYNVLNFTDRRRTLDDWEDDYSHVA